jgi:hypothetical protein
MQVGMVYDAPAPECCPPSPYDLQFSSFSTHHMGLLGVGGYWRGLAIGTPHQPNAAEGGRSRANPGA